MVAKSPALIKAVGTFLLLWISLAACGKQKPEAQAPPPVLVEVEDLNSSNLLASSEFVGSLEARQKVNLAPRIDGRVVEIAKQEGDTVKKGDLIVQLQLTREQGEVSAAQSNVNIQRANLSNAQAALRAAEAEVASAEAAVEQSRADLQQQEAQLELARTNLERTTFLVKQGAQSQQNLDNNTSNFNAAIAQKNALQAALNASQKALNASQERVSAARANIQREQAALEQAGAEVDVASENLEFNRIVAPIDGVVGDIAPKVGDYVEAGSVLTVITQNNALELSIGVPIEQASRLELGLPVEIVDKQRQAIAKGQVNFISPRADRSSQAILVKAAINNNGALRDEGFARARIVWSEQPGVLIPTEAISRIAGKTFVFVAEQVTQENGGTALVAKQKPVTLGAIQGQNYQVISGVQPGDRLIVSGILNLADGTPITTESTVSVNSNQ
ncbi:MAG: efflux RND transporter periplasmic adaptor subunit [Pleurocapsa sp.]